MDYKNYLICLVGMPGAGKSEVAKYLADKDNFQFFRFGQIVLDKVMEQNGGRSNEKLEREIRETMRAEHGMAAMAILNKDRILNLLEKGNVIGDGLRSYEEYLYLKDEFGDQFISIAVFAPPEVRYERLQNRSHEHSQDKALMYRSFTKKESRSRDIAELNNLHMGPTIAMASYTIINDGTKEELFAQMEKIRKLIFV